jgi:hypothetical protein
MIFTFYFIIIYGNKIKSGFELLINKPVIWIHQSISNGNIGL